MEQERSDESITNEDIEDILREIMSHQEIDSSSIGNEQQSSSNLDNQQQSSSNLDNQQQSSSSIDDEQQSSSNINNEQQSSSNIENPALSSPSLEVLPSNLQIQQSNSTNPEPQKPIPSFGCSHYKCKCEIQSPCCKQWFPCRLCHDKAVLNNNSKCKGCQIATMDRYSVSLIRCLVCGTEQPPQRNCVSCEVKFANYFCPICKIWVDDKPVYHCDKCGICRVGKKEDNIHCDVCNMDYAGEYYPKHPCKEKQFEGNCPICLQNFFTSRKPISFLKCGHLVHHVCLTKMIRNGITNCPCCQKGLAEYNEEEMTKLIEMNPMPKEYQKEVKIMCNECCKFSTVQMNWVAMRCLNCGSWNTKLA